MSVAQPIVRGLLHDEVTARLRAIVSEETLLPGRRINERALCEELGISRTPLREALKVLASEGLVELLPNRGARVARLTETDVREMFEVMSSLESLAGGLACARIGARELAEIRSLHEKMAAAFKARELARYFSYNERIHERILAAANNTLLRTMYASLNARVRRARYLANMSKPRWAEAMREHDDILRALEARDGDGLAALLRDHVLHKRDVVLANFVAAQS